VSELVTVEQLLSELEKIKAQARLLKESVEKCAWTLQEIEVMLKRMAAQVEGGE